MNEGGLYISIDWERLKRAHLADAQSVMRDAELDALLVTAFDNVRYLTCERLYMQLDWCVDHYGAILTLDGELWSCTSANLRKRALIGWKNFPFMPGVLIPDRWAKIFAEALEELGVKRGKIGLDYLPFEVYEELKKRVKNFTFVPVCERLLKARAVKNEEEVKLVKEAARVVDLGLEAGLENCKPGVTENEVFAKMLNVMTEAGSEGPPHFSILSSGKKTLENILSSDKKLREGELVSFDIGCVIGGYHGDSARTGFVKPAPASKEVKELYSALYKAHKNGIEAVKPGVKASEVDRKIRETLRETGYPDFPRSSGHGMGLREAELPWITSKEEAGNLDMELEPGMVFGLEPTTYKPNVAAAALEDMILVTHTGHEVLTKTRYLDELLV